MKAIVTTPLLVEDPSASRKPGKKIVLDDFEAACQLCLSEKVEFLRDQGWGLSVERCTHFVTSRQ